MRTPLNETFVTKSNGAGNASVKGGPLSSREVWYPSVVSVSGNTATVVNEASCIVSVGDLQTKKFIDGCVDGSSGDSTGNIAGNAVKCGQYVWADWTGGDANQQFTMTVQGEREV